MRKSRFSEAQIQLAVQQAEAGVDVTEICRKYGLSAATFYRWRQKYGSLNRSELQELKDLLRETFPVCLPLRVQARLTCDSICMLPRRTRAALTVLSHRVLSLSYPAGIGLARNRPSLG
jgi:putative transposase